MSIAPLGPCSKCESPLTFEFVGRLIANDESNYGVSWICPACQSRALDVCPVGPVIPTPNGCLNCGDPTDAEGRCNSCGVLEAKALAWFGVAADAEPALVAAKRDASKGLIRRALGRINHLLRDQPTDVDAWQFKARVYQDLGFHATAARMLRHAAEVTRRPAFLVSAGFSLQELQQHDAAIEVFRAALAAAPDDETAAMAWCNLGNAHMALDRTAEAEDAFKRAIELEPRRAQHAINHYALLVKLDRRRDAIAALHRGLRAASDPHARATLQRALAHANAELGDGAATLIAAEAAIASDASSADAWYVLGRAHGLLGNLSLGLEAMKHALTLNPDDPDTKRALGMFERALASEPAAQSPERPWWRFWS